MITQLEIKNFRGFSEYKIDDVGQVNLLVGTNNCGKTSVLEAIHLIKSRGEFFSYISSVDQRGERYKQETRMVRDFRGLFYGFSLSLSSVFSIYCNGEEELKTSIEKREDMSVSTDISNEDYKFHITYRIKNKLAESFVSFNDGGVTQRFVRHISQHNKNIKFIPAASLSPQMVVRLFEEILLTHDEDLVLNAVKIIEPDIIRLAPLGGSNSSTAISRGGIVVKSSKWEERIPIGSFGDGIWRLLGLALSLVGAKDGTLLIDEIDTGLHHTVMSKMWKLICATAKKLNVQVFATTHSRDCWETLADNAVEDEFADMPIRIHRINKDKKQATTFTNREMHLALNRDVEVR